MTSQNVKENPNVIGQIKVIALLAAVLLVGANSFVLSPILSEVAESLSTEPYHIAWAISAFGAATAVSALTLASMIDRLPAGRVLGLAAVLLAIAQVSSGFSQHWLWLCLSQALGGVGVGVLLPGAYATTTATAPTGRESARLGIVLTGWALSLVVAVPAAAFVTEHFGWRTVYFLMGFLADVRVGGSQRTSPLRALQIPGVIRRLVLMLLYMTAFYGSYAYFGDGIRQEFGLSAQGSGLFVLAYGVGFGVAGLVLGMVAPKVTRVYLSLVLLAIATSYATWGLTLQNQFVAFAGTAVWGMLNQLGLNGLVVSLNQQASDARGAVMGLNSAATYSAVFIGPVIMGPLYAASGLALVTGIGAVLVIIGGIVNWRSA